jgi:FKBP-type peptidyl-prolyl cis-trans isomerase (trigger factor)
MSIQVKPLHHVTLEFSLFLPEELEATGRKGGRHRFLYGVQTWIPGVDHRLEGLFEGDMVEISLEPENLGAMGVAVEAGCGHPARLAVRIVEVRKAEPREVIKALAATVHCCDHCEGH